MGSFDNLDTNETKILSKILALKKKQEVDFDGWLKKQGCLILSLNEFIITCFNDKRLQEKYFAVRYPPYTYEEYFPSNKNVTLTTTNKGTTSYGYGSITYSDDNYQISNIILFLKEKVKKILMLESFGSENHI
jgi:hypothetical protein